jgi:hypothetical protein
MYWYTLNDKTNKLPGMGGVFNPVNLNAYQYVFNNPILYVDPDGREVFMIGVKVEGSSGGGGAIYQGVAYCTGKRKWYFVNSTATSLGFRGDAGVDFNIITSDTFENYLASNTITVSGDYLAGGGGLGVVEKDGKLDFLINFSLGPGFGGTVSSSSLPGKTKYAEASKLTKLQLSMRKEQFNFFKSYVTRNTEGMKNSLMNMIKINNKINETIKESGQ